MKASGSALSQEAHGAIVQRAAVFFERRRFENWGEADQAEFDAWFAESVLHEVAYLRLEGAVALTEELAALRPPKPPQRKFGASSRFMRRRFVLPLLAAASVALVVTLGIPFVSSLLQPSDRTYSTDVGGRTLLSFSDRTQIELNTDTAVRYRMTSRERTVWLEKGEAWFHVAHDAGHPFTVIVGRHRVTDLGTEFLVRRNPDGMEIALLNGRAALSTDGAQTATLRPGDDAVATPSSMSVIRKTPEELADALAWRRGALVFRSTRLADAVREVNRYNQTKIVIADPSIADLKFTGEIRNDNFEGFLYLAQSMMKLRIDRQGKDILLSRDSPEKFKKAARQKRGA